MKRLILIGILTIVLVVGAACSSGSLGPSSSASSSGDASAASTTAASLSADASAGGEYQEYPELSQAAYLRDYDTGMWVAYGSPKVATGGGTAQSSHLDDEGILLTYDYLNLGDDASLTGEALFEACKEQLLSFDATRYDAIDADASSSSTASVNGWSVDYVSGTLDALSGDVPFAICFAHHGEDVTWCAAFDDTDDQSNSLSDLETWVEKISRTYHDYEA